MAREARPRAGGRGRKGVRGEPGKPGCGGFPGFPPALAGFRVRQVRRGIRGRCRAPSLFICAAGSVVVFGGRQEGSGEPGTGAVFFRGRGGSGFTSAFPDWSPLLSVYSCSRAVVFLTSTTLLFEGLRSGTRRRRGASASAQAGGETGPETRRTAPARAGRSLYAHCPGHVRAMCPKAGLPAPPSC